METLLERTLHLTPDDQRKNVLLPFEVPHDFDRLEITCMYTPKYITEPNAVKAAVADCFQRYLLPEQRPAEIDPAKYRLSNLLTLSLDCGSRYLGAAHRQAPEQTHIISSSFASPGFWRTPVCAGTWRAVINVHALAAGAVDYTLRIVGKEADET